jgi:hypothetical protein
VTDHPKIGSAAAWILQELVERRFADARSLGPAIQPTLHAIIDFYLDPPRRIRN